MTDNVPYTEPFQSAPKMNSVNTKSELKELDTQAKKDE